MSESSARSRSHVWIHSRPAPRRRRVAVGAALAITVAASFAAAAFAGGAHALARPDAVVASPNIPCSTPGSATRPCRFSTPSGNIHCLWTPASKSVECELLATHRAYLLRPTGHARRVRVALGTRGQTLPAGGNTIVFPEELSCRDTRTTMTCNQDFLTGFFTLARGHSRSG